MCKFVVFNASIRQNANHFVPLLSVAAMDDDPMFCGSDPGVISSFMEVF